MKGWFDNSAYGYLRSAIEGNNLNKLQTEIIIYSQQQYKESINSTRSGQTLIDVAFEKAFKTKNLDIIFELLQWNDLEVNNIGLENNSAISYALRWENETEQDLMLEAITSREDFKAETLLKNTSGDTLLQVAVKHNNATFIENLMRLKSHVDKDRIFAQVDDITQIISLFKNGDEGRKAVHKLLKNKLISPQIGNQNSKEWVEFIKYLTQNNEIETIKSLNVAGCLDRNLMIENLNPTYLYKENRLELLTYLIDEKLVDVNKPNKNNGNTLLHLAGINGNINFFEYLLKKVDVNLHVDSSKPKDKLENQEKSQGINLYALNSAKLTPLAALCVYGNGDEKNIEAIKALMNSKFNVKEDNAQLGTKYENAYALLAYASGNHKAALALVSNPKIKDRDESIIELMQMAARDEKGSEFLDVLITSYPDVYTKLQNDKSADHLAKILLASGNINRFKRLLNNPLTKVNVIDDEKKTLLHYAAMTGNNEAVKVLLKHPDIAPQKELMDLYALYHQPDGKLNQDSLNKIKEVILTLAASSKVDPNITQGVLGNNPTGPSLLNMVMHYGDKDILERLLENPNLDVNFAGKQGDIKLASPLIAAYIKDENPNIQANKDECLKMMLAHKSINPNVMMPNGETLLTTALKDKREDVVDILLPLNINVNQSNEVGNNIFLQACIEGNFDVAYRIAISKKELLLNLNKNEQNALSLACSNGSFELVEWLTSVGMKDLFDINKLDKFKATSLLYAYANGNEKLVNLLLEKGASLDIETELTPLQAACQGGNYKLVDDLLNMKRFNINQQDSLGNSALHYASADISSAIRESSKLGTNVEIVKALLKNGANINAKNKGGDTPLMSAVKLGDYEKIKLFLKHDKLDINSVDKNGNSPLMVAVANNDKEAVRLLLSNIKTEVNIKNNDGFSAYEMAIAKSGAKIPEPEELKNSGLSDSEINDKKMQYDRWKGDPQIALMLVDHGANPVFDKYDESLGRKLIKSTMEAGMLSGANLVVSSVTGGALSPIIYHTAQAVIDAKFAYNIYSSVQSSVESAVIGYLTNNTKLDRRVDMGGKVLIGLYKINRLGVVTSNEALKDKMKSSSKFKIDEANPVITAIDGIDISKYNHTKIQEDHAIMTARYYKIQNQLDQILIMPWTRVALNRLSNEILAYDDKILDCGRSEDTRSAFKAIEEAYQIVVSPKNRDAVIRNLLDSDKARLNQVKEMIELIKNDEIQVNAKTKHLTLKYGNDFLQKVEELNVKRDQLIEANKNPSFLRKLFGSNFSKPLDESLSAKISNINCKPLIEFKENFDSNVKLESKASSTLQNIKEVKTSIFAQAVPIVSKITGASEVAVVDAIAGVSSHVSGAVAAVPILYQNKFIGTAMGAAISGVPYVVPTIVAMAPAVLTGAVAVLTAGIIYKGTEYGISYLNQQPDSSQKIDSIEKALNSSLKTSDEYNRFESFVSQLRDNSPTKNMQNIEDIDSSKKYERTVTEGITR